MILVLDWHLFVEKSMEPTLDRRTYVGGSDIAAIIGVDPRRTIVDLYLRKIALNAEEPLSRKQEKFFRHRKEQEPVIAAMLWEDFGIRVSKLSISNNPNRYTHPEYPFFRAEIDYEFEMTDDVRKNFLHRPDFCEIPNSTVLNGEVKTVHPFSASKWGEEGSEEVPTEYAAQAMWGLCLAGRPACLVTALFGLDTLLAFPIMRDEETIELLLERAKDFWLRNVAERIPPEAQNLDDIKRLYGNLKGAPFVVSADLHKTIRRVKTIRDEIKRLEEELEVTQFSACTGILREMGKPLDAPIIDDLRLFFDEREFATWRGQRHSHLDQQQLKEDMPDVVAKYTRSQQIRILRIK
jgi:putative phage-type endonuclease